MPLPVLATVLFNAMLLRRSGASSSPSMYFGMVLSVAMFAGLGVLWSLVRNKYEREEAEQEQEKRHAAYEAYIVGNVRLLEQKRQKNQEILMRSWKSTRELMRELSADRTWMWNRNVNHGDFLTVRLGIGRVLSPNEIKVPEKRFQVVQDAMAAWPYEIQEKYCYLEQSVKLLEIARHRMIGVVGERERTLPVYASIILQLALLHAYTDVKMAFLLGKEDRELEWVRWLPHTLDEDGKFRLVANDAASARNVLYALSAKLQGRQEARKREDGEGTGSWPVYVVFCTDIKLLEQEAVYWYMTEQEGDGFHFVLLCRNMNTLPNACRMIVESSKAFSGAYLLDESYSLDNVIRYDALEMREAEYLAREMCGCRISEYSWEQFRIWSIL